MKRFLSIFFCIVLFSAFSVVAFSDDTLTVDYGSTNSNVDISSLFNIVSSQSRTPLPEPLFAPLFDYDPVTQIATAKLSDEFKKNMPLDVRQFLVSIEKKPSDFIAIMTLQENRAYIRFIEVLVPSDFICNSYYLTFSRSTNYRYVTFTVDKSYISYPTSVDFSKIWTKEKSPYFLGGSYLDGGFVTLPSNYAEYVDEAHPISAFHFFQSGNRVTVDYLDTDGVRVSPPTTITVPSGDEYSISSPSVVGYTPNQAVISGVMPDVNLDFTVIYSPNPYELTVDFLNSSGRSVALPVSQTVHYKSAYTVDCPNVVGYTSDVPFITGIMPPNDFSDTVSYSTNSYTLTINYVDSSGNVVHAPNVSSVKYGDNYNITSPFIDGLEAHLPVVSGAMPPNDHVVNVTYSKPMTEYDKILASALNDLSSVVSSNALVLFGVGVLLMTSLIIVILLVRILLRFINI